MKKNKLLVIVALPAIFVALIAGVFSANVSPYVSVTQVVTQNMTQRNLQVFGQVIVDSIYFDKSTGIETFVLTDGNNTVTVNFRGIVNNLSNSTEVVAIGVYDGKIVQAERVLVKCPSKYETATAKEA
ncbi:MAG: cytochrome c maturation protein CcmE [Thaumarchaeota archaeon]|nr:cytochrome c maturation protein CcmE [Nitrososphaerota archaeon]MCL5317836.1 cytochrome c maturation protein CcmE [Nitrososphaerota archaeon]